MTIKLPERVDPELLNLEGFEFEIICDIASLQHEGGFPRCSGDPARWVAWRERACGHGPQYRLICESCRQAHLNQVARGTFFYCGVCGEGTGPYIAFTPLEGKS